MATLANTVVYTINPTVDTSAYADGDNIGGTEYELKNVVNNTQGGFAWSVITLDYAKQTPEFTLLFFDAEPENTTFTDNAALDIHDDDLAHYVGHISVTSSDYASFSDNAAATTDDQGFGYMALNDSLWVVIVADGAATFTASTDLVIKITLRID